MTFLELIFLSTGTRIKEQRNKLKITQYQLAEQLGLTVDMVRSLESDRKKPSIDTLNKLADLYGCTTDYLLARTDDPIKRITNRDYLDPIEKLYKTIRVPLAEMDEFLSKMADVSDAPLTDEAYEAYDTIILELVKMSKNMRRQIDKKKAQLLLKEKN
jgi:transcriptional regulator with XRE-family HTH domain